MCRPLLGEDVDVWSTALWLWRRSLDEIFADQNTWTRGVQRWPWSWIWSEWVETVGRLLWDTERSLANARNVNFVSWLTGIWAERVCGETYSQFLGISCRAIGADWLMTDNLTSHLSTVGRPSVWVLETDEHGSCCVRAISTIAPSRKFQLLRLSGFQGNYQDYCDDFNRLMPLIRLLGTEPTELTDWRAHWEYVRKDYQRRLKIREAA